MESHSNEYRLTPKARNDMESIWQYSFKQWGLNQTERYIDALTTTFAHLAKNPQSGRSCDNIRTGYRKYSVTRHVIYYRKTDYGIEVMRVLHDKMLASRRL